MRIQKYINYGKYGTFEAGILFSAGIVRYMLTTTGIRRSPVNYIFENLENVDNKDLNKEILSLLCNYVGGSKEVSEDLLFMMNPDVVVQFVKDNIGETIC